MKSKLLLLLIFCCAFLLVSCGPGQLLGPTITPSPTNTSTPTPTNTPSPTPTSTPTQIPTSTPLPIPTLISGTTLDQACQIYVSGIDQLFKDLEIPETLYSQQPVRSDEDFDVSQYLDILDHLTMKPGYTLDFVYFSDELGSKPLVYARETSQPSFSTYEEYLEYIDDPDIYERSYSTLKHAYDFVDYIDVDQTPESYLQFIILTVMKDQFYQSWHALYNDYIFLCDSSDLEKVSSEINNFGIESALENYPNLLNDAKQLELSPIVRIDDETVTIRFVLFTKWGGFIEVYYVIDKDNPGMVLDGGDTQLLEFDCGVAF